MTAHTSCCQQYSSACASAQGSLCLLPSRSMSGPCQDLPEQLSAMFMCWNLALMVCITLYLCSSARPGAAPLGSGAAAATPSCSRRVAYTLDGLQLSHRLKGRKPFGKAFPQDPAQRPSAAELLQHPFLQPAADGSPPADLAQLVAFAAGSRNTSQVIF